MKTIYIAGGQKKNTAVSVLIKHLTNRGHRVTRTPKDPDGWDVTLRWGISYNGNKPALNAQVNSYNKLQAIVRFHEKGLAAPKVFQLGYGHNLPNPERVPFPWLARKAFHAGGRDIVVCHTLKDVQAVRDTHAFLSIYIPTESEYRIWVFQKRAFAVYEKCYKGVGEYKGFLRNHRFGFLFGMRDDLLPNRELCQLAISGVAALNMEFGATDIIKGKDGRFYLLEVNSMPNIDSTKRVSGIRLAKKISKWAEAI